MKRVHEMPFGAQVQSDGQVRFRLWGPKAREISVSLYGQGSQPAPESLPMDAKDGGWFELITDRASAGSRYKFRIDGGIEVPDPASRFQPDDVHGPSQVIDPSTFAWQDGGWKGRPVEEAVIYELHVGAFSPEGTFPGVEKHLDYLAELGVTAVELMPLADFPGARNWGYDGVLEYAPDNSYGSPEDLKRLVQSAHEKGLMIFLDVVYNHFGPDGNYLREYAPQFFTGRHHTPWGEAINFDGQQSRAVREFFIHNALYWLTEYNFDGLRLDAVNAIVDDSKPHILTELAETVRTRLSGRQVHLVLENDDNAAHYLPRDAARKPILYDAQWNDDIHHSMHATLTGEKDGYYIDYADNPVRHLARCLAEGFDFQGQASGFRNGAKRGEPSKNLPPTAFVSFLQNHDQVGNRAFGERIAQLTDPQALKAAMTVLLLAPAPPLLFMGEEFAAKTPFLFFCNFGAELAKAVTEGRRGEFARFSQFNDPARLAQIPDPNAAATFEESKLDWNSVEQKEHRGWLDFYRVLLRIRRDKIVPQIASIQPGKTKFEVSRSWLSVQWLLGKGELNLIANLGNRAVSNTNPPAGSPIFTCGMIAGAQELPPWSAGWFLVI